MGYIAHHAIVVTGWNEKKVDAAHAFAKKTGACVSPVSEEVTNGYLSFCVFPDGSKEGWDASEEGDVQRETIVEYLRGTDGYLDFVEVQFGGDFKYDLKGGARIVNASLPEPVESEGL